jgi:hypothetical protein
VLAVREPRACRIVAAWSPRAGTAGSGCSASQNPPSRAHAAHCAAVGHALYAPPGPAATGWESGRFRVHSAVPTPSCSYHSQGSGLAGGRCAVWRGRLGTMGTPWVLTQHRASRRIPRRLPRGPRPWYTPGPHSARLHGNQVARCTLSFRPADSTL